MAVTIRQIAAAANVSRGTVDRVLHARPGVRPEIAAHVRKIADEMGFLMNRAGKILAAKKQPIKIGCFFPGVKNPFFDDVVKGFRAAEKELSDFGVSVETRAVMGYDVAEHVGAIRALADEGCAALCVSTADVPEIRACVDALVESGIPVVTVNNDISDSKRLCYVGSDYTKGGRTAAGLLSLITHEKQRILIVTGSLSMKGHNERISGFSQALKKNGVEYELADVFESQDNDDCAYAQTLEALRAHTNVNCIYIAAAGVSGVCRAVTELGMQKRLRILCFDDIASTKKLLKEGIIDFTICQSPKLQGSQAINLIFEYFLGDRRVIPKNFITESTIKIRENIQ